MAVCFNKQAIYSDMLKKGVDRRVIVIVSLLLLLLLLFLLLFLLLLQFTAIFVDFL